MAGSLCSVCEVGDGSTPREESEGCSPLPMGRGERWVRSWGFIRKSGRASGSSGAAEAWLTELVRRHPAQWRLDVEQCFGLPQAQGPERLHAAFGKNRTYCVSHVVLVWWLQLCWYHSVAVASRRTVGNRAGGCINFRAAKGLGSEDSAVPAPADRSRDREANEKGSLTHPSIGARPSPDAQTR
jgi:hypothetical protein